MSTHKISARNKNHEVTIGFDPGLSTFFAVVIDTLAESDEERELMWLGGDFEAIPDADSLAAQLSPLAVISDEMRAQLCADKQREAHEPTELQKQNLRFLGSLKHTE